MYRVDEWNNSLMKTTLPTTVFLILCFCIGVLGNSVVLFIYKTTDIPTKGPRFFIPVLALVDLIAVVISSIVGIVYHISPISSITHHWCLTLVFGTRWLVCASVMTISAISFDRYRRICHITKQQFTLKERKMAMLAVVILSALMNTPVFATSSNVPVFKQLQNSTLEGFTCVFSNNRHPVLEKLYSVIGSCIVIGCFIASSVFNIRILHVVVTKVQVQPKALHIFQQRNHEYEDVTADFKETELDSAKIDQDTEESFSKITKEMPPKKNHIPEQVDVEPKSTENTSCQEDSPTGDISCSWRTKILLGNRVFNKQQKRSLRSALKKSRNSMHVLFLTIFVFFIIAHVPSIITTIYTRYDKYNWIIDDNAARINAYCVLMAFPILSHTFNPYLYGLFDNTFRQVLKRRLRC